VIAGNRYGIKFRHFLTGIFKISAMIFMEGSGGIRVTHHESLLDIILNRPRKLFWFNPLLFCSNNIKAIMGSTAPFMVIETDISDKGI
jgi:hypothetical protein